MLQKDTEAETTIKGDTEPMAMAKARILASRVKTMAMEGAWAEDMMMASWVGVESVFCLFFDFDHSSRVVVPCSLSFFKSYFFRSQKYPWILVPELLWELSIKRSVVGLLHLILTENKNKPHYEVEY